MWFDTILWLVAIVAFIMVEAATTALVSVWFAVGAAAAMLVSFFNVAFGWQMLVFAVVSAITLGLMLPRLISRRAPCPCHERLAADHRQAGRCACGH